MGVLPLCETFISKVFWLLLNFPEAREGGCEGGAYQEIEHEMMKMCSKPHGAGSDQTRM